MRCIDKQFVDFVTQCLQWDAEKRLSPDDAMRHEWLKASSTSSLTQHASEARRSPSEGSATQRRGTLPNSDYRFYRRAKFSDGDAVDASDAGATTKVKVNVSHCDPDPSLDDSGTFLPPIL